MKESTKAKEKEAKRIIAVFKKIIDDNDLHCVIGSDKIFAEECIKEKLKDIYSNKLTASDSYRIFLQEVKEEINNIK